MHRALRFPFQLFHCVPYEAHKVTVPCQNFPLSSTLGWMLYSVDENLNIWYCINSCSCYCHIFIYFSHIFNWPKYAKNFIEQHYIEIFKIKSILLEYAKESRRDISFLFKNIYVANWLTNMNLRIIPFL